MIKYFRPSSRWVCSSCARRAHVQQRRWQSVASQTLPTERPIIPAAFADSGTRHDDELLRDIFDSQGVWRSFNVDSGRPVGLFRNGFLTSPDGYLAFAKVSLSRAERLVSKIFRMRSNSEYRHIVRDLDRLSDILCRVLDLTDFVRVTHPSEEVRAKASKAWRLAYKYMNELNTTRDLYLQLDKALEHKKITTHWGEEERAVAEVLRLDFQKSAIDYPESKRGDFVRLSTMISEAATQFLDKMEPARDMLRLDSSRLRGLDLMVARQHTQNGVTHLPTASPEASVALRTVHDAEVRREIYCATRTAKRDAVEHLDDLVRFRHQMAQLTGFDTYAHLALQDRMMAKSPAAVKEFLCALAEHNADGVRREVADLLAAKQQQDPSATTVEPWDKDYYAEQIRRSLVARRDSVSSFFSLGTVMQGLSRLFARLYGIRLVPRETLPGETWDPEVRRLDVVSDTDGRVAVLYCDLFYRPGKSPNPAHFTIRCSREIGEEEMDEVFASQQEEKQLYWGTKYETLSDLPVFETREEAANDGMALSDPDPSSSSSSSSSSSPGGRGARKQLPTIVLVCDFPRPTERAWSGRRPTLLSFHQVETLFHEMGHAIHSFLARTSFQNVAGTRCATDLAELPSTLMEHFAADPSVLALFARHHETDKPLPYELVADRLRATRRFQALDMEHQILLAMLDQALHSIRYEEVTNLDSTRMYHFLQRAHGAGPPDPEGTCWQGFFGHLSGYAATYYSYMFDKVLAQRVWRVVFKAGADGGALSRENGEHFRRSLLRWGGARDPWRCLADTLGDERLAKGDETAMRIVGSWGTGGVHV